MYDMLFREFLESNDTLRIYRDGTLVFSSAKERLIPLVEYLDDEEARNRRVVIMDRVTGNAAACLPILTGCTELYSSLGSGIAVEMLKKYPISFHFAEIVPYIQQVNSTGMCPVENLSLGKSPEEFYRALLEKIR